MLHVSADQRARVSVFLTFMALLMPSLGLSQSAQDRCPARFRFAGTLTGNGSFGEPSHTRVELNLPDNATFDTSYQQGKVVSDGRSRSQQI